jgi:YidC/Oxa1 family membrane protein insertase
MEKRILLAFALSFVVLFAFSRFSAPPQPVESPNNEVSVPPSEAPDVSRASGAASEATPVREARVLPPAALEESNPFEPTSGSQPEIEAQRSEELTLETGLYYAVFSNVGGALRSLRLRDYAGAEGEPLELISQEDGASLGWPLSLATGEAATDEMIRNALFVAERRPGSISMEFRRDGLHVRKEFRFDPDTYGIEVDASISRGGRPVPFSVIWQGRFGDQSVDYQPALTNVVYREAGDYERVNVGDIDNLEPPRIDLTTQVGLEDPYFLAMFLAEGGVTPSVSAVPLLVLEGEDEVPTAVLNVPTSGMPVVLYVGPKEQRALEATDATLTTVIDYGFFEILARPLLLGLLWIHSYIGNYGWSIVLLTLFINFVLFPLRLKQQLSMQKMQKIQPQMRTLQDKYKKLKANDPKRPEVQAEMMGLYKKHGVNPMGGCLPLLLQMPFLFAFFSLLRVAIELRGAPWMLWIQDLSAPDPVFVLPVLMGGSMFVMQKMTPTTADPAQAKIMMMMPVMLTVMFVIMPVQSGLMLYWLTSNLVGVGQQYFIKKFWASGDSEKKGRPDAKLVIPVKAEVVDEKTASSANESEDPKKRKRRSRRK